MKRSYSIVALILLIFHSGMTFLYITLGYILSIGFWAKPLITNETIRVRKKRLPKV